MYGLLGRAIGAVITAAVVGVIAYKNRDKIVRLLRATKSLIKNWLRQKGYGKIKLTNICKHAGVISIDALADDDVQVTIITHVIDDDIHEETVIYC